MLHFTIPAFQISEGSQSSDNLRRQCLVDQFHIEEDSNDATNVIMHRT